MLVLAYMEENKKQALLSAPVAIVISAIIIGGAIVWTQRPATVTKVSPTSAQAAAAVISGASNPQIKTVSSLDHILGNPNAPIKIVEYSDPSCPYCKVFNPVMWQIMAGYGSTGQIAWVYRSFPIDKPDANGHILHPNSGHESEALECAATLGGNDKFWAFQREIYTLTPSVTSQTPKGLDQAQLPVIAKDIGLNVSDFNSCLASGKETATVEAQYQDGLNAGVAGTPYSFIVTPGSTPIPLPGAQSYSTLKNALDILTNASSSQ